MSVAIIDYGSGNLRSAAKAFERCVAELGRNDPVLVTSDPETVLKSDRVVLPGVGAFADCRKGLAAVPGMEAVLEEAVIKGGKPFLGICVGMQLMAERGLEHETTDGLGWIKGDVTELKPAPLEDGRPRKVPHMGWNRLSLSNKEKNGKSGHPVLGEVADGAYVYFVHGFHMIVADPDLCLATADYGQDVTAIVGRDNLIGTQFHPEKSQDAGLALLRGFLRWTP